MKINTKVYKPFIMGLLAVSLGIGFSFNAHAQQGNFLPIIQRLVNNKLSSFYESQEGANSLEDLPPVTFYSPETGAKETLDLQKLADSAETPQALEPTEIDEEDNENSSADDPADPTGLVTFSGKSDLRKVTEPRIILLEIEVKSKNPKKKSYAYCSGAMISRYTVLTAAHCLHELKDGGTIKAYAGGKNAKHTSYKKETWYPWFFTKLIPTIDFQVDYGYVILKDPLGDYTGTFGGSNPVLIVGDKITSYGFPACSSNDRPSVSKGNKIALPKATIFQQLLALFDKYGSFRHSAYIDNGMSGGPIFAGDNLSQIVAVTSHFFAPVGKKCQLWATGSGLGMIKGLVIDRRNKEPKKASSSRKRGRR